MMKELVGVLLEVGEIAYFLAEILLVQENFAAHHTATNIYCNSSNQQINSNLNIAHGFASIG